jgi:hypothetical protein
MRYNLETMLPLGAFEHYGNRHIKLYGGGGSWNPVEIVENAVSSVGDAVSDVVQGAGDVLADVDEFVGDTIPGGWTTVASIAVPYAAPYVTGAALTAGQAAALAAATSATSGAIQGRDPEDILKSAALAAAGSYIGKGGFSDSGIPNWDADITAGAEGYANAAGAAGAGAGSGLSADMNLDAPYVDMPDGEYLLNESIDQGGLPDWDADITAGAEGYEEAGGLPSYPGDSQYIEQDLQEQARNTNVESGSPTSWDRGDPSLPTAQEALKAANRARQLYNVLGGLTAKAGTQMFRRNPLDLSGTTTGSDLIDQRSPLDLTAEITKGNTDFSLLPETTTNTTTPAAPMVAQPSYAPAQYGFAVPFASGGRLGYGTQTGNYAAPSYTDRFDLTPVITRGNTSFRLPGYEKTRIFAAGGEVSNHQPEFYSEGGLNSLENRYVKGAGDGTSDDVPAMLANGEFVIPADVVSKLGNGSNDAGANVLDEFLQVIRQHAQNHDPKKLPPDSKGALAYLEEAQQRAEA